jgi:hypothetical protein
MTGLTEVRRAAQLPVREARVQTDPVLQVPGAQAAAQGATVLAATLQAVERLKVAALVATPMVRVVLPISRTPVGP